jgi:hypothetical protein
VTLAWMKHGGWNYGSAPVLFFCHNGAVMPEPELVDAREPVPAPDPEPDVLTAEAAEDTAPVQPLAADPPLDQPVLPNPVPPPENYHISLWDEPQTYACLRCALRGVTLEAIAYHLRAAHGEEPVPTALAANPALLLAPQSAEAQA